MAIDKSRTSLGVKIVLIVLIVAFVALFVPVTLSGLFQNNQSATQQNTQDGGTSSVDAINAKYAVNAQTFQTAVASEPTSYTALVNLGNTYLDWGGELRQAGQASQANTATVAASVPLFEGAKNAYTTALEVKPGDKAVEGDLAIALFYTGDVNGAIVLAEKVIKKDPKFSAVWFNLGNFYATAGQNDQALKAYQEYLKLEPQGELATAAQQNITQLQSGQ